MINNENEFTPGESNAERDQDAGNMNNGTIGGSMGISGSSNDSDEANYGRVHHDGGPNTVKGDTGGGADNGSKAGSRLGLDGGADNAGGQQEGSAAENI
ncbi:MAG: hypothetical protein JWQ40_4940 [Segetibacter sp.]|jgi:hypothetical protein|nr:hypothetical protein [Segetibacter sp.]